MASIASTKGTRKETNPAPYHGEDAPKEAKATNAWDAAMAPWSAIVSRVRRASVSHFGVDIVVYISLRGLVSADQKGFLRIRQSKMAFGWRCPTMP